MGKNRNIGANDDPKFWTGGRGGQTVSRPYAAEEGTRLPTESYCTTTIELIDSGVEAGTKKRGRRNGHGQSFPLRKSERSPCRDCKTTPMATRNLASFCIGDSAFELAMSRRRKLVGAGDRSSSSPSAEQATSGDPSRVLRLHISPKGRNRARCLGTVFSCSLKRPRPWAEPRGLQSRLGRDHMSRKPSSPSTSERVA